ncbi:unnamed protein product [Anisakis simplex]|uniref:Peptidase_S9_N domain-containing protein n=1 Tax=Anisakis simplex TaxID=6269 RepID=A0A0M3J4B8_ANISI|nr:unnamed protein product [Anisakis simplex]
MLKGSESSSIYIDPAKYPLARKDPTIVEDFHGTKVRRQSKTLCIFTIVKNVESEFLLRMEFVDGLKVPDPYRWLEDPDSDETKAYVDKLNAVSEPFIGASPIREKMRKKLIELWDYEKYGCTSKHGQYYYHFYNPGLHNQSLLYQQKTLQDKGVVFLDPNKLSLDGTTSIRVQTFTRDGSILAYGISHKGSDWMTLKVILYNSNFNLN